VRKWLQLGSAIGFVVTTICAISILSNPFTALDARIVCSLLLVSFGYLFSSRAGKKAEDPPWWW
jgi:hypothetical protein